ncbi:RING finger domain and kelch repeat-containing protein DDB_G0271372-like [Dreissena polymorpha]|uniref:B box-type domain-containing protein n=1 Tax=Dreissena polymorpha TaxID=45954 RepID=A0A9D4GPE0_DREPO|nr:RING finger domain and kelch repeat-containing protein DDB_G0271372-like [Dreissena polymorpha]KAH3820542.1 hypothetical protein DPMN_122286 [Dreissena polymorpha]
MASNLECSIHSGSDLSFDFSCFICQENDGNTEAEFYCDECSKFYCSKCVEHHNYLYKKHAILNKENISQWPETNVDELEQCQEHKKEKLTGFCEDHSQLICQVCHEHNHKECSHVVLIVDKVKEFQRKEDFKQMSATVDTQHQQLVHLKDSFEENMKSLEISYKKILEELISLRKAINNSLDELEKNTKKDLDIFLATMRTSIKNDIEICTRSIKNITFLKEDSQKRKDKNEEPSFIKYRKCIDQSLKVESVLQEMTIKNERTLMFYPDTTIQQTLSTLSGLGQILDTVQQSQTKKTTESSVTRQNKPTAFSQSDPGNQTSDLTKSGQVSDSVSTSSHQLVQRYKGAVSMPDPIIKVKSSKTYKVDITGFEHKLSGICETAAGELLILDGYNSKLVLLDHTYKIVNQCDLPRQPNSMCRIDSNRVAVTAAFCQIYFIRVSYGLLIIDRTLKLQHECWGIAHHQRKLYITAKDALYRYTVDGRLLSKIYEDNSSRRCTGLKIQFGPGQEQSETIFTPTVSSCAVSPDGERIYATNVVSKQLVTLSRDGTVISTLAQPAQDLCYPIWLPGLHVTDSGQVLLCGLWSETVHQVDRDGRQILAEVVKQHIDVSYPTSVYYSKRTSSMIVGMQEYNEIVVFKTQ